MQSARPVSPDGSRPRTRSQRVWTLLLIGGAAVLFVAAFLDTVRRDGVGGAFVTALLATVAYGIPVTMAWVWLRGHQSQEPAPFTPPPASTAADSTAVRAALTLRATASARWGMLVFCLAIAAGLIGYGVRGWIVDGKADFLWAPTVIATVFLAMAYSYWSMYIKADDLAVVYRFVVTRRYDRREVAAIEIGRFLISYYTGAGRRVSFFRSDGSVLFSTLFSYWGKDELEALATYLGIPIRVDD